MLVPAYHHGVEVEALIDAGVRPRFYGVGRDFIIDKESLIQRMTLSTRAIYVIHYAGFPQPMDDIHSIARTRGLKVIEDCALSLYSSRGVQPLGTRSDAAIFCLYKTLPVPHGGALWMPTKHERIALKSTDPLITAHQMASSFVTHLDTTGSVRATVGGLVGLARSVHPLPVDARPVGNRTFAKGQERLGISRLVRHLITRLDAVEIVERRRRNYYALMARLRDLSTPLVHALESGVSPLFYPFWCDHKSRLLQRLSEAGIETIDFWNAGSPLVKRGEFPDVDALRDHVLELPIHQDLELSDIDALARAVRQAV